jgi:hypothetical protein
MLIHVIHVTIFMSFKSIHVICRVCKTFPEIQQRWGGGVKYVFLGLRRQLRCYKVKINFRDPRSSQKIAFVFPFSRE